MAQQILTSSSTVLVTGVTGLIGGEIVRLLARSGVGQTLALVRPRGEQPVQERLLHRLERSGEPAPAGLLDHVVALPGDITAPRWGLNDEDWQRVRDEVDVIIHCAADTSFLCRPDVLQTNVAGTRNLVELAQQCRRSPLVVYMSTATNAGKHEHRSLTEVEGCRPENEHHNGYTKSKAVAEKLLRDSGLPVLTLRPTIVLSAGLPDADFARQILWFIPLARRFAALPLDPDSRVDVVPVSYVAEATLALLRKSGRRHDCYHLSAGASHSLPLRAYCEQILAFYQNRRAVELVPPSAWTPELTRACIRTPRMRKVFYGLQYYLPFLNMDVVFDNTRLFEDLGRDFPSLPLPTSYLDELLGQISVSKALQETAIP
jgi:thioester reductase-like protein